MVQMLLGFCAMARQAQGNASQLMYVEQSRILQDSFIAN
jgi:hypothetical protein